jgi:DNA polymerase elongation subunit (family B)
VLKLARNFDFGHIEVEFEGVVVLVLFVSLQRYALIVNGMRKMSVRNVVYGS